MKRPEGLIREVVLKTDWNKSVTPAPGPLATWTWSCRRRRRKVIPGTISRRSGNGLRGVLVVCVLWKPGRFRGLLTGAPSLCVLQVNANVASVPATLRGTPGYTARRVNATAAAAKAWTARSAGVSAAHGLGHLRPASPAFLTLLLPLLFFFF